MLALYLLLAVGLTWPLACHLGTHVVLANIAAFGDPWVVGWSLAHVSRALAGLAHGGIFHPASHGLFYGETGLGALPLFIGPYLLTRDPILGLNVVLLGGLALTAWSLHVVTVRWTGSQVAGFLSGWTFLACPFSAWAWGPSAANYVTLWYWPWIVLYASAPAGVPVLALAALVFVQGLSTVYVAVGLLGPLLALATVRLASRGTRRAGARLLAASTIAALGWGLAFMPYLRVRLENPDLARQTLYPFLPLYPLRSALFDAGEPSGVAPMALGLIALGAIARVGGGGRLGSAWRHCLVWIVVGLVLALPPRVAVLGHVVPSPVGLLADVGVPVHAVRDNGRRGIAALIGLALLVGVAYVECVDWVARRRGDAGAGGRTVPLVLALLVAVGIFHGLCRPVVRRGGSAATPGRYPLFDARASRRIDSPIMTVLREPGGPLLELPTAPGVIRHADAMHRAAVHGRAILNGLQGYWPGEFPGWMAIACRLPDPEALATLRAGTGLELILVHLVPEPLGGPVGPYACPPQPMDAPVAPSSQEPWRPAIWEEIARGGRADLTLVVRDGDDLLFRVAP